MGAFSSLKILAYSSWKLAMLVEQEESIHEENSCVHIFQHKQQDFELCIITILDSFSLVLESK